MVLKKQTVWLLTMLSLIIVLSVYYITAPEKDDNLAYQESSEQGAKTTGQENAQKAAETNAAEEGTVTSSISSDEYFAATRLSIEDERSAKIADYTAVIASDASLDLRNNAHLQVQKLQELSRKEQVLENLIRSEGYSDALVYTIDDNKIKVIVKADQLSNKEANQLMVMAKEQLGDAKLVSVQYQPTKK
ncbi:SpoIIIAH-like family protein [Pseudalkalibacillus caeni]|uniref:SpoIIIAH-like family protein n=1 Tax=Exobacillus caeni TaxID=2574798 RepID=A0A5R9F016_9BACL|nr:SpoIIIAH-like family protein [Pseudalkalibacillus caeni]TLS36371.1 SpoIIIAH-like family protein [Pseudalkalibacillus caeni]